MDFYESNHFLHATQTLHSEVITVYMYVFMSTVLYIINTFEDVHMYINPYTL